MSLFGSLMGDVEEDPFFGSHMRTMRQMNNMMNSLFSDPFGMMGGGPLAIGGPRHHGSSLMPFMPQMPSLDRLYAGNMDGMGAMGSSYSSSTVVMSSGPNGKPQVYSSSSSTKIGPNGIKETRKTLQDTRTGTKKMSIGHHIGERAHVIEREQNVYSGDAEETQEFINIEEEEAEDFDREFQVKAGSALESRGAPRALCAAPPALAPAGPRRAAMLALPPAPLAAPLAPAADTSATLARTHTHAGDERSERGERGERRRPTARRPIRAVASPLTTSPSVRDVYGSSHPQRHRHKHHKSHRHSEH